MIMGSPQRIRWVEKITFSKRGDYLRNPELRAEYDAVRHVGYDSWKAKRRNGDALDHCFPGSFGSGG